MATTFILFTLLGIFCLSIFVPVEIETEGWCNSGDIKLDIEAYNHIQNNTCWDIKINSSYPGGYYLEPDKSKENITCFDQTFMLDHIKLKGIDGLNCEGRARIKMPMILGLFMGDGY